MFSYGDITAKLLLLLLYISDLFSRCRNIKRFALDYALDRGDTFILTIISPNKIQGSHARPHMDPSDRSGDSSSTRPIASSSKPGVEASDDAHRDAAGPKLSKSQGKHRRQAKKRHVDRYRCGEPQSSPIDIEKSSSLRSAVTSSGPGPTDGAENPKDVTSPGATRNEIIRRRQAPVKRVDQGHSVSTASDPTASAIQHGLSEMSLEDSGHPPSWMPRMNTQIVPGTRLTRSQEKRKRRALRLNQPYKPRLGLRSLPTEIQLQILEACIVTGSSVIELITCASVGRIYQQPRAHKGIALGILRTCRLYWEEGSKMFWERNRFLLCSSATGPAFIGSLSPYTGIVTNIKHIALNYTVSACRSSCTQAVMDSVRLAQEMSFLETLEVELVVSSRRDCSDSADCEHEDLAKKVWWDVLGSREEKITRTGNYLQRVTVTTRNMGVIRTVSTSGSPIEDLDLELGCRLLPALLRKGNRASGGTTESPNS